MNHEPNTNYYEANSAQKKSIARYAALIIVLVNTVLTLIGMPVIPVEYADIIAAATVVIVGLWVGFKNNYLTRRGKKQANILADKGLLKK